MTELERSEVLRDRQRRGRPWHSPPTWDVGRSCYLITAACYEHLNHIGYDAERLSTFSEQLLAAIGNVGTIQSWVVLPNHYHVLLETAEVVAIKAVLKQLHGRTAFEWNGVENRRGRKVWHAAAETRMKSEGHYWATMNYVHHNPVKHRLVGRWQEWPWSSANAFLEQIGEDKARQIWKRYPIQDYGKDWDR